MFGGANALGYALSGVGYDRLGGAAPLFGWAAALELVALAALLAPLVRDRRGAPAPI